MRIAVLGGTRFIGRFVLERLDRAGHELLVVHRGEHEPPELNRWQHAHADRHDPQALTAAVRSFDAEAVVDVSGMNAAAADAALAAFGEPVRLVAISSGDVYRAYQALHEGWTSDPVPLTEDAPLRERRHLDGPEYENLELEERYLPRGGTVLRLAAVYGEHDYQRRFDVVLSRLGQGLQRLPFGSGSFLCSRVYAGDLAEAVRLVLDGDGDHRGQVYNIAERVTASYRLFGQQILDLARELGAAPADAELVTVPDDELPPDLSITGTVSQHLVIDAAKARTVLGWSESDPLDNLRRSIRWHLDNPG